MAMGGAFLQDARTCRRCDRERKSGGERRACQTRQAIAGERFGPRSAWPIPSYCHGSRRVGATWPCFGGEDSVRRERGRSESARGGATSGKSGAVCFRLHPGETHQKRSARDREAETEGDGLILGSDGECRVRTLF